MPVITNHPVGRLVIAVIVALVASGCGVQPGTLGAIPISSTSTPVPPTTLAATPAPNTSTPAPNTSTPVPRMSTPVPRTSTPASTTKAAATPTALGPMTDREILWLERINRLQMTMGKVLVDSPSQQTPATLRSLGEQLRGCTQDLAQLGSTTERLQPVYQLAKRGCAQYDEAAQCFDTVASITDTALTAGSGEEQKLAQAINCGSAAVGNGGTLLVDAVITGSNIKQAAG